MTAAAVPARTGPACTGPARAALVPRLRLARLLRLELRAATVGGPARHLAAATCWAIAAYLGCVGVLYGVTAQQAAWGGPPLWPVAVGAASTAAVSALGFAAGRWSAAGSPPGWPRSARYSGCWPARARPARTG